MIFTKEVETKEERSFYYYTREKWFVGIRGLFEKTSFDTFDVLNTTKHFIIKNNDNFIGVFRLITGQELPALHNIDNFPAERCVELSRLVITDKCPVSRLELLRFLYDFCISYRFEYVVGEALDEGLCEAFKRVFPKSIRCFGKSEIKDPAVLKNNYCYPVIVNILNIAENPIFKKLGR
ncbi:MAG: hypothetical protein AAB491_03025 [Patescibacteria group bacterium]